MNDPKAKAVIELYEDYIRWSGEFLAEYGGIKIFSQLFTGGADYKQRSEHKEFFARCEDAAEEYLQALKSGEADKDDFGQLMQYVLIDCHSSCDDWAEWMLLAAEKNFLPHTEFLTAEQRNALYEPYRRLRKKNRGLPPQEECLKKLKKGR